MKTLIGLFLVALFSHESLLANQCLAFQAPSKPQFRKISQNVVPTAQDFQVEQVWQLRGVTRGEVLEAIKHLRLTGTYGVYQDSAIMATDTPEARQNQGGWVVAEKVRPYFSPGILGSTAFIEPTADGFMAGIKDGPIGTGRSRITISDNLILREIGLYSLSLNVDGFLGYSAGLIGAFFPGAGVARSVAHQTMGELHNSVFNPAQAIVNIILERRRMSHEGNKEH